jgi:hypothetical protein
MTEKYYYLTIERILNIILCIVAYALIGVWLFSTFDGSNLQVPVSIAYAYTCLSTIYFLSKVASNPPYVTEFGDSFAFTEAFGCEGFDENENSLGICEGAYLTKRDIRLMVGGKFYDINDVYFQEDDIEEWSSTDE